MRWFQKPDPEFWRTLILTVVVGLVAGALGAIATWSSLLAYRTRLILEPTPVLTEYQRTAEAEVLMRRVSEKVVPALANIFVVGESEPAYFLPHDAAGSGIVLTADGWVISHESVVSPRRIRGIRVGVSGSLLRVERIIADTETGILFMKTDASNLRAAVFGESAALGVGDAVYALRDPHALQRLRIDETRARTRREVSSDSLGTSFRFDRAVRGPLGGGPVLGSRGEVLGIFVYNEDGTSGSAVPIDHVASLFDNLLARGTIVRPTLGVRGVSLVGGWSTSGRARGFLIQGDDRGRAVTRDSPAEEAGLRTGDIILRVNDTVVNGDIDLSELLLAFRPGETIDLEIQRVSELLTVPVKLGERDSGKVY